MRSRRNTVNNDYNVQDSSTVLWPYNSKLGAYAMLYFDDTQLIYLYRSAI